MLRATPICPDILLYLHTLPLKNTIINHAVMLVGRDLWRLSSPNPLLKPCPVKLGYSEPVLLSLENLQGRRLHSHSGPHSSV